MAQSIGEGRELLEHLAPLPQALVDHVLIEAPGQVLVSELKVETPDWHEWLRRARMLAGEIAVSVVGVAEIQERRELAGDQEDVPDSEMQQVVVDMLSRAVAARASDVHLTREHGTGELEFRIHGSLQRQTPYEPDVATSMMNTIMNSMISGGATGNKPNEMQDARLHQQFLPKGVAGVRIAVGPITTGRWMAMRLLHKDGDAIKGTLEQRCAAMGYSPQHSADIRDILERPMGIMVISGVTNSGKSTTLKHLFEAIADERPGENIVSVEDPAEYHIDGVKQQSVNHAGHPTANAAFNAHVRFLLRADPDRALIGEMRDRETFELAITFTRTGHPIGTTVHASRWFSILERAADELRSPENPDPLTYLAQSNLFSGLVYQRLTKRLCPHCAVRAIDHQDRLDSAKWQALRDLVGEDRLGEVRMINPAGCDAADCAGGVVGRTLLAEVVPTNPVLMEVIRQDGIAAGERYWKEYMDGRSIFDHAKEKLIAGLIDPLETAVAIGPLNEERRNEQRRLTFEAAREGGAQ